MGKDASGNTGSGMGGNVMAVNGSEGHVPTAHPNEIHVNEVSTAPKLVTTGYDPKNLGPYARGKDT